MSAASAAFGDFAPVLREFLADAGTGGAARAMLESEDGYDARLWQRMATELGLAGLCLPAAYGGSGQGPLELGLIQEQLGYALTPSPFFATVVLGAQTLLSCATENALARWLPPLAAGTATATLALSEADGRFALSSVRATAELGSSGDDGQEPVWLLTGDKTFVPDGHTADVLFVVARAPEGLGLFAVEGGAAGVSRARLPLLDDTRPHAQLGFRAAAATRVSGDGDASADLSHALDLIAVALAAEQIGGARACLDSAVEYAGLRHQFGRPIGSFQAIKHQCADLLVQIESSQSASLHARELAATGAAAEELAQAAALSQLVCGAAFTAAAKRAIQIHGGIGYTWEHDAHLFLKRAKAGQLLYGSPASLADRFGELVGL